MNFFKENKQINLSEMASNFTNVDDLQLMLESPHLNELTLNDLDYRWESHYCVLSNGFLTFENLEKDFFQNIAKGWELDFDNHTNAIYLKRTFENSKDLNNYIMLYFPPSWEDNFGICDFSLSWDFEGIRNNKLNSFFCDIWIQEPFESVDLSPYFPNLKNQQTIIKSKLIEAIYKIEKHKQFKLIKSFYEGI